MELWTDILDIVSSLLDVILVLESWKDLKKVKKDSKSVEKDEQ